MPARTYWLDLFTGTTWNEFLDAGAKVSGFRESRWTTVQKIRKGDYLLCYLTGISRFIGVLEVESEPYKDDSVIWKDQTFPCRVRVKPVITLKPETGVPVYDLRDKLSCFLEASSPVAWTGHFRGSPTKWKPSDGEAVLAALEAAQANPIVRPIDKGKLARRPRTLKAKIGEVTVPEADDVSAEKNAAPKSRGSTPKYNHSYCGWDQTWDSMFGLRETIEAESSMANGSPSVSRFKTDLPLQFDEATNRTIELIDVLWLKGNSIIAAFEIESTTSVYSGLLRMSDLMQCSQT